MKKIHKITKKAMNDLVLRAKEQLKQENSIKSLIKENKGK